MPAFWGADESEPSHAVRVHSAQRAPTTQHNHAGRRGPHVHSAANHTPACATCTATLRLLWRGALQSIAAVLQTMAGVAPRTTMVIHRQCLQCVDGVARKQARTSSVLAASEPSASATITVSSCSLQNVAPRVKVASRFFASHLSHQRSVRTDELRAHRKGSAPVPLASA